MHYVCLFYAGFKPPVLKALSVDERAAWTKFNPLVRCWGSAGD